MIYKYKAISQEGQSFEGFFEAEDEQEVLDMLRGNGYLPLSIEEDLESQAQLVLFSPKVKKKDLAVFCRQFYTMINSGIGIVKSFEILEVQTGNKTLKKAIGSIYEDVQKGYTISQAMKSHEKVFPLILVNMIEAGEVSGNLDSILERMAVHFEKENKLDNKIKSAMIYPVVLIVVSIAVIIFMIIAVLPTFVGMFTDSGIDLPWPTQMILDLSDWLQAYWYLLLGGLGAIFVYFYYYSKTEVGKKSIDNFKIQIPGVRITNIKIITSRFTRTLSTLISSGIPLLEALDIVGRVLNNKEVEYRMVEGTEDIRKGVSLSRAVKDMEVFPPMVDAMIKVGEESGSLDDILYRTADFYDEEVETSLERMTTLIEPILLVFMALIIGFIVIALALPMFDMVNTI